MSKKFHILALCGFGDILSAITRLPAVKEQYPEHEIVFWLGGVGKSVEFSKQQLEREGYSANIVNNLNFHNQLNPIRELIRTKIVEPGDEFQDWSFCDEIFNNEEPLFYHFPMQLPYQYESGYQIRGTALEAYMPKAGKFVAVHPLTKSGNAEGFESDVEKGRFWNRDEWKKLCELLITNNFTPVFVGYEDEDWGLIEEFGDKVIDARGPVLDTIRLLKECDGGVFCNSWDWEVTSRAGIPTYAFYTKNHFFIQNHVPHGPSDFWDNTYIETANQVTAEEVWDKLSFMIDYKKRPEVKYSVCMITYNDEDCIQKTLDNVAKYKPDEFVVTDGGSTDLTKAKLVYLSDFYNLKLLDKPWVDDFETQKNHSLSNATNVWRIWIDADETYEHIFWNQLPWYIRECEEKNIDCIQVPRINTITGLSTDELQQYAQRNGWQLSGFSWVNYPDNQQRVFNHKCKFVGRTHERIVGADKEVALVGQHCLHPKTKSRQERGLTREQKQYQIESEKVASRITYDGDHGDDRPVVLHHLNNLCMGGTEKMVQLHLKYMVEQDRTFNHVIAYQSQQDRTREPYFRDILGTDKLIPYASFPELIEILKRTQPFILHHYAAGITEFPMVPGVRDWIPKTKLFQTAVFGNQNEHVQLDKVLYVSKHIQHLVQKAGKANHHVVRNPVEGPYTDENLREELGIPEDAFVFGRIGRDTDDIYDPINIQAFAQLQDGNSHFVIVAPSDICRADINNLPVSSSRFHFIDKTTDESRLSRFYNTISVLAHARKDGECNPANVWEAFAHGKPVISHYGTPFNGHIEVIGNAGFIVPPNDVEEYARIMNGLISGKIDYRKLCTNAKQRWLDTCQAGDIAMQQISYYKEFL
jgi:glycosyltransferase involved in cell wall biosynthesis